MNDVAQMSMKMLKQKANFYACHKSATSVSAPQLSFITSLKALGAEICLDVIRLA